MTAVRDLVFDWLFNASLQVGLFSILAAALSAFIARARATVQHSFYLLVFVLCIAAPICNTLWQNRASGAAKGSQQHLIVRAGNPGYPFWTWNGPSKGHEPALLATGAKNALVAIWQLLFLYQVIRFSRGIYRVRRLRLGALSINPGEIGGSSSMIEPRHRVSLLHSTAIDDPIAVGVFHPAIILPSKLIPTLEEPELTALLAHEYAHIRRKDFLVLLLCRWIALPLAWHPGLYYLMSKISQTRELACDEYAAACLGKPTIYARALLRLASLCLQVPRGNAMGLGIFNDDNLEDRIMMLTEKRSSLSRAGLAGLALTVTFLFGASTVLARAISLQEASSRANNGQMFTGTWHWMFHGQSFATMVLVQSGSGITGTATGSRIALDDEGELAKADPSENGTPSPITEAKLEGNALHVTVMDHKQPFEFIVTLKDPAHAEIHPVGAPPNMKPIQAEKVD